MANQTSKIPFFQRLLIMSLVSLMVNQAGWTLYPFLAPFSIRLWRKLGDYMQRVWIHTCFTLMSKPRLVINGQIPNFGDRRPKVFIANHSTEVDWLYLWMLGAVNSKQDATGSVKIILKEAIKSIPVFGWGCTMFQFIFLKRDWKVDAKRLDSQLHLFNEQNEPLSIIIFPEGTVMNTKSHAKTTKYAKDTGRPILDKVLLPRSKGLEAVLEALVASGQEPEVFDLTMSFDSYSGEVPTWDTMYDREVDTLIPNVKKVFSGTASENCYIDSRCFLGKEILKHGVQDWLDERFERKDQLLKHFISHGKFATKGQEVTKKTIHGNLWFFVPVLVFNLMEVLLMVSLVKRLRGSL